MSCELEKYKVLMEKYHRGDFGKENLTMSEILNKAGESDLLDRMSVSDLQYLTDNSSGITREMFCRIKAEKE